MIRALRISQKIAFVSTGTKVTPNLVNSGWDAGFLPLRKTELKILTFYLLVMFFGPSQIRRYSKHFRRSTIGTSIWKTKMSDFKFYLDFIARVSIY